METGVMIALVFAAAVILLAVIATRFAGGGRRRKNDPNGSQRDGDAHATWIGIHSAGRKDMDDGPRNDV